MELIDGGESRGPGCSRGGRQAAGLARGLAAAATEAAAVVVVPAVPVLHVEMEPHQLQQHHQVVLESVIQLPELQPISAAVVVHLGTGAQVVGVA